MPEHRFIHHALTHGDLKVCTVCGGAESSLPTECPGYHMTELRKDLIAMGYADFRDDRWTRLPGVD